VGGPSDSTVNKQNQIAEGQLDLATKQQKESEQILGDVEPGLKMAEDYYQALASGDIKKITAAVAPASQQISSQTEQAKNMIKESTARGGAQDLAVAEADISKSGQIGNLVTQAYTGAFPALASLFSTGGGISVSEIANAVSSAQGASQTTAAVGNEQAQGKATTMGFLGSLAGAAGQAAGGGAFGAI
jgi:hypothetical protein